MNSDSPEEVDRKVMGMYTDPRRVRADIPGEVEGNPVFIYHDIFNPDQGEVQELKDRYRKGTVGDVEVKRKLATAINLFLDPHRIQRDAYAREPDLVLDLLRAGAGRMRTVAGETLATVRSEMGLDHYHRLVTVPPMGYEPAQALSGLAFL